MCILLVFIITRYRETIKDTKCAVVQLNKILYHLALSYDAFHIRVREAVLAFTLRLIHLLRKEIQEGTLTLHNFSTITIGKERGNSYQRNIDIS